MMRRAITHSSSAAAPAVAASATFMCSRFLYGALWLSDLGWMRFFKPCTATSAAASQAPAGSPGDKEPPPSSREAFVHTPSLEKEMKTKDIFNAAKRKEAEAAAAAAGKKDGKDRAGSDAK